MISCILNAIYALIMLPLIMVNPTATSISLIIAGHAMLFSIYNGITNVFAVELFPVKYRYSCYAFCHSIGMGVIGGTSPMVAALITKYSNNPTFALGFYLCLITLSAGVAVGLTIRKQRKVKNITNVNFNETLQLAKEI